MGVVNSEEGGEAGLPAFLLDFLYLHKYNDTRVKIGALPWDVVPQYANIL